MGAVALVSEAFGVSGCRLSDGRLHLGHYLGCLHPEKTSVVSENFFVIQDHRSSQLGGQNYDPGVLRRLVAHLYGVPSSSSVVPCLQSSLFTHYAYLFDFARTEINIRTLDAVHPKKDDLRSAVGVPLRDYLFPVDQAVQFLGFSTKYVLMNDDNLRFVNLAKRLHGRIAPAVRKQIAEPQLLTSPCSRLLGSDGTKMAKANMNTISFDEEASAVEEHIKNYARRSGWRWGRAGIWSYEGDQALEDSLMANSPLATLVAAFLPNVDVKALRIGDTPRLISEVSEVVLPLIHLVHQAASSLLEAPEELDRRFGRDNERAVARLNEISDRLLQ